MPQTVQQRIQTLLNAAKRYRRYLIALVLVALVFGAGVAASTVQEATALNKGSDADTYRYLDASFPKQDFEGMAGDVRVTAQAPRGALPAGTTMHVAAVDASEVEDVVMSTAPGIYEQISAVDVVFIDPNGQEIQPLVPITVTMTNINGPAEGSSVVLHVDDQGNATVVKETEAPSPADEVAFEAESFSVYIMAVKKLQQTMTASDGRTYEISVTYTEDAGILDGAELVVREVTENDSNFSQVFNRAKDAATSQYEDATVTSARFFDISIMKDGATLEPLAPVEVNIVLTSGVQATETTSVVHLKNSRKVEVVDAAIAPADAEAETGVDATFTTESFSIFGVIEITIEKDVLASDGNNYHITVTCGSDAGVPAGATLDVTELLPSEAELAEDAAEADPNAPRSLYEEYLFRVEDALGLAGTSPSYARLFDIRIVDRTGRKVEINAPVSVRIELADKSNDDVLTQVVHFADRASEPDVLQGVNVEGEAVSFEAEGFSVYAIVDAPDVSPSTGGPVASIEEFVENPNVPLYLSLKRNNTAYYITNTLNTASDKQCFYENTAITSAALWTFVPTSEGASTYWISTTVNKETRYISHPGGNYVGLVNSTDNAAVFEVSDAGNGTFYIKKHGEDRWLQHSNGGNGLRFYTDTSNAANSKFTFTRPGDPDPYMLDGKTYGIAFHDERASASALMAQAKNTKQLVATDMLMRPDVLNNEGVLLVAEGSDISQWTFNNVWGVSYRISTEVDGATKYLAISGDALKLVDSEGQATDFTLTTGTDANKGKYNFSANGYSIEAVMNDKGVGESFKAVKGTTDKSWLNLVKTSTLPDDSFTLYSARKVSVSDLENVKDGKDYVIYTRVWNNETKRYEFYAVNHDGALIRCYDVGDNIEWLGSNVNTAEWEFTEHRNPDGTLNYYYDLQNTQYNEYLAPQVTDGKILFDKPVGINLNGRRYGESYTTIIAWDEDQYAYAALKVEGGKVVACPLSEADDFYFAILNSQETSDEPTTVNTIDSTAFGITMKMVDFNNKIVQDRDSLQTEYLGRDSDGPGLVSTNLTDNYPTTTKNPRSLSGLFNGATPVNHLFLESIYNESGYFEYDSTQNFARLNDDGNFTVYNQLGSISDYVTNTSAHGQFMPYNDLVSGKFIDKYDNRTNVLAEELADTDPRKGEKLYDLGTRQSVDYFFGMEMEASFTQTANGLDAWGHDIIFDFSGDDDFWFYVDGELVLDLGGVHSAMTGSVNFRTGQITTSKRGNTTLYEVFKKNYQGRGMSEADITAKLDEIFTLNEEGNHVFKDYTSHTMRVFYMERGAGASNLHMRFNLAAIKPGTFLLSKSLSGTESASNNLIAFPYQVYYESKEDSQWHLLGSKEGQAKKVVYKGTAESVTYLPEFTPSGGTVPYAHVFMLKPGQTAEVALPDDALQYRVVECGINPDVYDKVTLNGDAVLTGKPTQNKVGETARCDYVTPDASLTGRPEVKFDNHVNDAAVRSLTITKKLYDVDGKKVLTDEDDPTAFSFRLYLGSENESSDDLPASYLYPYLVKDELGNYCKWDAQAKKFVSLGITDHAALLEYLAGVTPAERDTIVFVTSPNGAIAGIPVSHSVELHDLIAGTQFKVEEREKEIPRGYTLRLEDGYQRTDTDPVQNYGTTPVSGTIQTDEDPAILVSNQKGWGLTVKKVWTDKDFMSSHGPIYMAVFVKSGADDTTTGTLLEDSVRKLEHPSDEIYYFFGNLQAGIPFRYYTIYEVTCKETTDEEGKVVYTDVTPIEEGGTLENLSGTTVSGMTTTFDYTVNYRQGEQTTHNENVRTDTVTNSRPGIELLKTDADGSPLAGATFTLTDQEGNNVAAATYTSDANGRITTAYLGKGTYTLTEISSPKGYVALPEPVIITVGDKGSVTADGPQGEYEIDTEVEGMLARITMRDHVSAFQIKKVDDSLPAKPLENVKFDLYKQVTDSSGKPVKDNVPMDGYTDLLTNENGIVNKIDLSLPAGTYYLQEKEAVEGYDLLQKDICFTIGADGTVEVNSGATLHKDTDPTTHKVSYVIVVTNGKQKRVSFRKVDISQPDKVFLEGAEFDLYALVDGEREKEPLVSGMVSGKDGILVKDGLTEFSLPIGVYHLVETKAPDGYNLKAEPVVITVTTESVTYEEGTSLSSDRRGVTYDSETSVYLLKVTNTSGYELPESGGMGTVVYTVAGTMMVTAGALLLAARRRNLI